MPKSSLFKIACRILGLYVLFTATRPFMDLVYAVLAVQQAQANPLTLELQNHQLWLTAKL